MTRTLETILDILVSMPPADLIGALLFVPLLSLGAARLYALARPRGGDPTAALAVAMALVSLTSLVAAAAYFAGAPPRRDFPGPGQVFTSFDTPPPGGFGPGLNLAPNLFRLLDADKDGRLGPDEAAAGIAALIRDGAAGRAGGADIGELSGAINRRLVGQPLPAGAGPPPWGGPPGQESPRSRAADPEP
jgi:hypothetical protein